MKGPTYRHHTVNVKDKGTLTKIHSDVFARSLHADGRVESAVGLDSSKRGSCVLQLVPCV